VVDLEMNVVTEQVFQVVDDVIHVSNILIGQLAELEANSHVAPVDLNANCQSTRRDETQ
jgi:hypothetical protein